MTLGMTVRNGHKHHVNHMTTCSFPPPRTSQLQAVDPSEKSDCLARCARFTKRATPDHGQQLHVHPCCRLYELFEDQAPNATCHGHDQVHHAHLSP